MSAYFLTLTGDVRNRYLEKISVINHFEPYTLWNTDKLIDITDMPEITSMDLVNYFILKKSYYSGDQLKAFKSLDAFKNFEAGFVLKIVCTQIQNHYIVLSLVSKQ